MGSRTDRFCQLLCNMGAVQVDCIVLKLTPHKINVRLIDPIEVGLTRGLSQQ